MTELSIKACPGAVDGQVNSTAMASITGCDHSLVTLPRPRAMTQRGSTIAE
ncbi:hypothetical protein ACQP1P_23245 [Dactylosporangium sp. CA-052675]|uniref:hypothetical protein n=1 Tax=Dactylosporangium sp. CA-052675 TaxID=3239927 RepID=UPI003D9115CB